MPATVAAIGSVTSSTTQTIATSAPSGVVAGAPLVLVVSLRSTGRPTPATPSGWTLVGTAENTGIDIRVIAWWRYAAGDATDTPTVDLGVNPSFGMQAVILRLDNVAASSPIDDTATGSSSSSTPPIPVASVAGADSLAIAASVGQSSGSAFSATWPSPWTEHVDSWVDASVRHLLTIGSAPASPSTSPGGNLTLSETRSFAALTLVVKPAAGGSLVPLVVHHLRQQGAA